MYAHYLKTRLVDHYLGNKQRYAWSRDSEYLTINQSLVEIEQMRWIWSYEGSGGAALVDTLMKHY